MTAGWAKGHGYVLFPKDSSVLFMHAHFCWTSAKRSSVYTVPGDPSKPFENAAMKKAAPNVG
jgi:hypothetical protein